MLEVLPMISFPMFSSCRNFRFVIIRCSHLDFNCLSVNGLIVVGFFINAFARCAANMHWTKLRIVVLTPTGRFKWISVHVVSCVCFFTAAVTEVFDSHCVFPPLSVQSFVPSQRVVVTTPLKLSFRKADRNFYESVDQCSRSNALPQPNVRRY